MISALTHIILSDLVTRWITLWDVGKLDSAICERVQRYQLLHVLRTGSFGKRTTVGSFIYSSCFLSWVQKRRVRLQLYELFLNDILTTDLALQNNVLTLVGPSLKRITSDKANTYGGEYVDQMTIELSLQCSDLRECEIHGFGDGSVTALLARNPNMKRIQLERSASHSESNILHIISSLCPNVERVDVECTISALSFERFLQFTPVSLKCLRLPIQSFTFQSLCFLLMQCPSLLDLRIGLYLHTAVPTTTAQLVHPCLKVFRVHSDSQVSAWVPALSKVIPNLATLIVLVPTTATHTDLTDLDSATNVTLMLNYFRCLRQLLVGNPNGEGKLSELYPLSVSGLDKPAYTAPSTNLKLNSLARTFSAPPVAGSRLEELFSQCAYEISTTIPLPALLSIRSDVVWTVLPATVKKLVVTGWNECTDAQLSMPRNLHELDLEIGGPASNTGINHIARQNPHLRILRIVQCKPQSGVCISADGFWNILQKCPLLHTVEYKVLCSGGPMCTDWLLQEMCKRAFPNIHQVEYI